MKRFRHLMLLVAVGILALLVFPEAASAASVNANPVNVSPGGSIVVSGSDWVGSVSVFFRKGNTVLQAGSIDAPPNGGSISATVTAPMESGTWELCVSGTNLVDGTGEQCVPVSVVPAVTTTPPPTSTIAPTTTTTKPAVAAPTSTSAIATTVAAVTTLPTESTTPAVELVPVTLPLGPDGTSDVEEEAVSVDGSGLSGLGLGVAGGIIALTGIAVVGLASSGVGAGPQRRTAVGVGVAGVLAAAGVAVAVPPPKVNVPTLSIVRTQSGATIERNSQRTISTNCPAGTVVIGGGWWSDWSSYRIDDIQIMVSWMEKYQEALLDGSLTKPYVLPLSTTSRRNANGDPEALYHILARGDGTVHYSDQVWPSGQRTWISIRNPELEPTPTIPWSEEIARAMRDQYYWKIERSNPEPTGLLLAESIPFAQGWRVEARLPETSLQSSVDVRVVALCATAAGSVSDDGVMGARIVASTPSSGIASVSCDPDEVALGMGWKTAKANGLSSLVSETARVVYEGSSGVATSAVLVCAEGSGLEVTTTSRSTTVSGGYDSNASAECPAGRIAVGGGVSLVHKTVDGMTFGNPHSVMSALPIDNRTFGITVRGLLSNSPKFPTGSSLTVEPLSLYPLGAYASSDRSETTVQVICARRVLP